MQNVKKGNGEVLGRIPKNLLDRVSQLHLPFSLLKRLKADNTVKCKYMTRNTGKGRKNKEKQILTRLYGVTPTIVLRRNIFKARHVTQQDYGVSILKVYAVTLLLWKDKSSESVLRRSISFDYRVTLGFGSIAGGLDHVNIVITLPFKHGINRELWEDTFSENKNEDSHDHVDRVLNIVDRLTPKAVNNWGLLKNPLSKEMKKELSAHQETIFILSQAKEAQIKLYKTRKDKELDKVIALENKIKVLDNIVYKTSQSVQPMNMLNSKCKTSFAKPEFLKKAQRANPRLYDRGCYNENLALMLAPKSDEVIRLEKESQSKLSDLIRPFLL
nr:hypothetical protein [Tanacetum cinerariifolium]